MAKERTPSAAVRHPERIRLSAVTRFAGVAVTEGEALMPRYGRRMALDEGATVSRGRAAGARGLISASVLMTCATACLIWLAAVPFGSGVCPAIDPPPLHCSPARRAGTGLVATICVVIVGALAVVLALWGGPRARPLVIAGVVVLVMAPFVTYAVVAFSAGFLIR
ncbi:hypothetical protein GCM10010462_25810 [Microbacterium dextranolyticum]|uniref:Uncharacterized protein n=2 Tax=Microbacterium dextranolyticum TaxID=36806 RepID=A0A9W6HP92_9MICO|nr:hypothetical protein GCM10017591_27010 [Microbacterium dextranolyticum]